MFGLSGAMWFEGRLGVRGGILPMLAVSIMLLGSAHRVAFGQTSQGKVEIEQKLGEMVDLNLSFVDEAGRQKQLRELIDGPTVLTLVYYRCPGICTPLLNEVASVADQLADKYDLKAGEDYRLLTISFDPRETTDLAKNKGSVMRALLKHSIAEDGWQFMTGQAEAINALTESVGFRYLPDLQDFMHAGTVIFLSKEGKIISYLDGGARISPMSSGEPKPRILAMEMKLAITNASAGTTQNLMRKIQALCFSYDRDKGYVLKVNRIILGVTLVFAMGFAGVLFLRGRGQKTVG